MGDLINSRDDPERIGQRRQADIQRLPVFFGVGEDADRRAGNHIHVHIVNHQPFLNHFFFIKLNKRRVFHHRHHLKRLPRWGNPPQAPAQGLFGQNIGFGAVGAQGNDRGDVTHVPSFTQHQNRDDAQKRAGVVIQLSRELPQRAEVFIADFFFAFHKFDRLVFP